MHHEHHNQDNLTHLDGSYLGDPESQRKLEEILQRGQTACLSLGLDSRLRVCHYIPLSQILKKNITSEYSKDPDLDKMQAFEILSLDAPFSWGDNNRTLVTASRLLTHWINSRDIIAPSNDCFEKLVEDLESLGETYIDLEN